MLIAIPKERRPHETRVAASPDTVKKFVGHGFDVVVEKGAGTASSFTDEAFEAAGAKIAGTAKAALKDADLVLKINRPMTQEDGGNDELANFKKGAMLACHMSALVNKDTAKACADAGLTVFAMELLPRITRAQSMDILSSQNNLAGYVAVLEGAHHFNRAMPMMMTAAGTVAPARVLVMGAGVSGLQAIATAKRLGGVVHAYDVRPATKEQVESLGGKFVVVDEEAMKEAETAGGYAKEMGEDYKKKEAEVLAEQIKKADIIITTALIPGRPAPVLVSEDAVKTMKPGSVIVDLAVETGGNCPLSEYGKVVEKENVILVGHANFPGLVAADASQLFAKNMLNFFNPFVDKDNKTLAVNWDDDLIKGTLVSRDGQIVHPQLAGEGGE